ncbi:hypothetical protein HGRIS_001607 [Hohenbuehelia grisea]|uniref:Nop domain-containing protein n=1 Tax=Hohenbuehelia grisea TaxID=104357 RepID=A0ABR3JIA1_9AGAR
MKAQLGLRHSYSRAKLKFNINHPGHHPPRPARQERQILICVCEWYGYHYPELFKLGSSNHQYARIERFISDSDTCNEEKLPDLARIHDDPTTAQNILDVARGSMGSALSLLDMLDVSAFVIHVANLVSYLSEKMNQVAPSLTALLGDRVGARLSSHAGSLKNLSKYPASTVQILGAEKALFRALKTKGNTPEDGLIYYTHYYYSGRKASQLLRDGRLPSKNPDARKVLADHTVVHRQQPVRQARDGGRDQTGAHHERAGDEVVLELTLLLGSPRARPNPTAKPSPPPSSRGASAHSKAVNAGAGDFAEGEVSEGRV